MRFILLGDLLAPLFHLAWTDLPLTVEYLITDKSKAKLEVPVSCANTDWQGIWK